MTLKNYTWLFAILCNCHLNAAPLQESTIQLVENPSTEIADIKSELADAQLYLLEQRASIQTLEKQLESEVAARELLRIKAGTISLFGQQFEKPTYIKITSVLIWSLLVGVIILAFRTRFALNESKRARQSLGDIEEEFDDHIHKALEREQKLRRQLQDEINRQKIADAS